MFSLEKAQGRGCLINVSKDGIKNTELCSFQWCPVAGQWQLAQVKHRRFPLSITRCLSLWGWRSTGMACSEHLWSLHPWRYSRHLDMDLGNQLCLSHDRRVRQPPETPLNTSHPAIPKTTVWSRGTPQVILPPRYHPLSGCSSALHYNLVYISTVSPIQPLSYHNYLCPWWILPLVLIQSCHELINLTKATEN